MPDWAHMIFETFSFKKNGGYQSFLWGNWYPCFGLLVTSALGFKVKVDPVLASFVACVQRNPQIHLWCNTCWPLGSQHGSQVIPIHKHRWARVRDLSCRCLTVWYQKPTSARNQAVKKPKMMASLDSRSCHGTPMCAYSHISFFHSSSFHAADAMSNSSTLGYPSISHLPNVTYKTNTNVQ